MLRLVHAKSHGLKPSYLIGKVAELTGASCKAIRLYEEMQVIPKPARRGKYRIYSEQDIFLIHMIKQAQGMGFSLNEIRDLVCQRVTQQQFPLEFANQLLQRKRAALRDEMDDLQALDRHIADIQKQMNDIFA